MISETEEGTWEGMEPVSKVVARLARLWEAAFQQWLELWQGLLQVTDPLRCA